VDAITCVFLLEIIAWLVPEIRLFKIPIDFLAKHRVIASGFSRLAKQSFRNCWLV